MRKATDRVLAILDSQMEQITAPENQKVWMWAYKTASLLAAEGFVVTGNQMIVGLEILSLQQLWPDNPGHSRDTLILAFPLGLTFPAVLEPVIQETLKAVTVSNVLAPRRQH